MECSQGFPHNSSLEGAMKLKFVPLCSSLDALSGGIIFCHSLNFHFLAENRGLYNSQVFRPKSRPFFVMFLLLIGRCYEAEICAIPFLFRCSFRWYHFLPQSKILSFWPKTMDYSQAFWPKSRPFFVVFLLLTGRCYEAEICAIPLLFRCSFRWYHFLPQSKFSVFGQKPWTIVRRFGRNRGHSLWCSYSSLEGAMKLKFVPFRSSLDALSGGIIFCQSQNVSVFGRNPCTIVRRFEVLRCREARCKNVEGMPQGLACLHTLKTLANPMWAVVYMLNFLFGPLSLRVSAIPLYI